MPVSVSPSTVEYPVSESDILVNGDGAPWGRPLVCRDVLQLEPGLRRLLRLSVTVRSTGRAGDLPTTDLRPEEGGRRHYS